MVFLLQLVYYIHKLKYLPVTLEHLDKTGVGRTVNTLRYTEGIVGEKARALVHKWKIMVIECDQNEDDNEEDEQDQDDGEDYNDQEVMIICTCLIVA